MLINLDSVAEALGNMENDCAVVKMSAMTTLSGEPDPLAIDLVRALIVHSKYRILFLFTDMFADVEEQIQWLNENVYKYENERAIRSQLIGRMICSNNWAEVLRHPSVKTKVCLAVVDSIDDVKTLYKNTDVKPIYLPRRK